MANYHFAAQAISVSDGRSAVAAAAYRRGVQMDRIVTGIASNYTKKQDVVFAELTLPKSAPDWARVAYSNDAAGSERLWNDIELRETEHSRRDTATLAREYEFSLPIEQTLEQNIALAREFITENFVKAGLTVDWVVHDKAGNPHVHAMVVQRRFTPDGFGNKAREIKTKRYLLDLRVDWADVQNRHLELNGYDIRVDHRSYKDQGVKILPTQKHYSSDKGAVPTAYLLETKALNIKVRAANAQFLTENPAFLAILTSYAYEYFTEDDVFEQVTKRLNLTKEVSMALAQEVIGAARLVAVGENPITGKARYALEETVIREQQLVKLAQSLCARDFALPMPELQDTRLSHQQAEAVQDILSPKRLSLITGRAGSGKTFAVKCAAEALFEAGIPVYGGALSSKAASELRSQYIEAKTLAGWMHEFTTKKQAFDRPFVFMLDEAGMVGSRQMLDIMTAVEERGGKLVLIGDEEQLQPVAAASIYRRLRAKFNGPVIDEIRRQADPGGRIASYNLSCGKFTSAMSHYFRTERFHHAKSIDGAIGQLAKDYWTKPDTTLALSHTVKSAAAMNKAIRIAGFNAGVLKDAQVVVDGALPFAANERFYLAENLPHLNLTKGTFGALVAVEADHLVLKPDGDGANVVLRGDYIKCLEYGYATTIHKSQSGSVPHTQVLASKTMDRHLGYVALTRHVVSVDIYLNTQDIKNSYALGQQLGRKRVEDVAVPEINVQPFKGQGHDGYLDNIVSHTYGLLSSRAGDTIVLTEAGVRFSDHPRAAIDSLLQEQAAFSLSDLARHVSGHVRDPMSFARVMYGAVKHEDILVLQEEDGSGGERILTTQTRFNMETRINKVCLAATAPPRVPMNLNASWDLLTVGQKSALLRIDPKRGLLVFDSASGSGKTTLGSWIAQSQGDLSRVAYITADRAAAQAAKSVLSDKITPVTQYTRSAFENTDLMIIDDAQMLTQTNALRLLEVASTKGIQVVLLGDSHGVLGIDSANIFKFLTDRHDSYGLGDSRRQSNPVHVRAAGLLQDRSEPATRAALALYSEAGELIGSEDFEQCIVKAAQGFVADTSGDKIILARSKAQVDAVTQAVLAQTAGREIIEVETADADPVQVSVGDWVRVKKSPDNLPVSSRTRLKIDQITGTGADMRIGLSYVDGGSGNYITIDPKKVSLEHDYARVLYSANDSYESVHLLAGMSVDRASLVKGLSRHRQKIAIYAPSPDPTGFLTRALSLEAAKPFAMDYIPAAVQGAGVLQDYVAGRGRGAVEVFEFLEKSEHYAAALKTQKKIMRAYTASVLPKVKPLSEMFRYGAAHEIRTLQRAFGMGGRGGYYQNTLEPPEFKPVSVQDDIASTTIALVDGLSGSRKIKTPQERGALEQNVFEQLTKAAAYRPPLLARPLFNREVSQCAQEIADARQAVNKEPMALKAAGIKDYTNWVGETDLIRLLDVKTKTIYEAEMARPLEKAMPSDVDRLIAKADVLATLGQDDAEMALARGIREVLAGLSLRTPAEVRQDQDQVLERALKPILSELRQAELKDALSRAFTQQQLLALSDTSRKYPKDLPRLSRADRKKIAATVKSLAKVPPLALLQERSMDRGMSM